MNEGGWQIPGRAHDEYDNGVFTLKEVTGNNLLGGERKEFAEIEGIEVTTIESNERLLGFYNYSKAKWLGVSKKFDKEIILPSKKRSLLILDFDAENSEYVETISFVPDVLDVIFNGTEVKILSKGGASDKKLPIFEYRRGKDKEHVSTVSYRTNDGGEKVFKLHQNSLTVPILITTDTEKSVRSSKWAIPIIAKIAYIRGEFMGVKQGLYQFVSDPQYRVGSDHQIKYAQSTLKFIDSVVKSLQL